MVSPYASIVDDEQANYNRAAEIAAEYSVGFYNFNLDYDSIGLDFATDCADKGHLNYLGSEKYTKYLGKTLINDYAESVKLFL